MENNTLPVIDWQRRYFDLKDQFDEMDRRAGYYSTCLSIAIEMLCQHVDPTEYFKNLIEIEARLHHDRIKRAFEEKENTTKEADNG